MRRVLGVRRVGHAGTLDPFASGLLLVLVGRATRLARFLVELPKQYTGVIALGRSTDTDDRTGTLVASSDAWQSLSPNDIAQAATSLTGRHEQRPPAFSAKKLSGTRAYHLARQGKRPHLAPVPVHVYRFLLGPPRDAHVPFEADVSSGTYIRALARDLGDHLGCGAHLNELRRTGIGSFRVADATPLGELTADTVDLRPPLEAVSHLPRIPVDGEARSRVAHGRPIEHASSEPGPIAVVADDELIAIAEPLDGLLKPTVVLVG